MKLSSILLLTIMIGMPVFAAYGQNPYEINGPIVPIIETSEKTRSVLIARRE